jgi:hypothetical protein
VQYVLSGGLPLEIPSPYAWTDLPLVKFAQDAELLILTHPFYPTQELRETSITPTFSLTPQSIGTDIGSPGALNVEHRNGTDSKLLYGYVVTAVNEKGNESQPTNPFFVQGSALNQNTGIVNVVSWNGLADAVSYRVYKSGPVASGNGNVGSPPSTLFGFIGETFTTSFTDNNVAADLSDTPPRYTNPFQPGQIASIRANGGGGYAGPIQGLTFVGDGFGAEGYAVVDTGTGIVTGAVLTKPGQDYSAVLIGDTGPNTASYSATIGQQDGTYPSVVGFYQQRLVLGGTPNFPQALVLSRPGLYNNFDVSTISQDDDAITVVLSSQQANAIKSIIAMPTGLIVLTSGGGFLVSGGGAQSALTPTSIASDPQASPGANDMPPLAINSNVLYWQNRGSVMRDLQFNFYVQSYSGTDRSVLASHLFTGHTMREWAYAEEPLRLVQTVRDDGLILPLTYVPEQEIYAWTRWETLGYFRSICTIPEGNTNATYVIAERLIQNQLLYYIERFDDRQWGDEIEACWCVDSGLALPRTFPPGNLSIVDQASGEPGDLVDIFIVGGAFAAPDVGKVFWWRGGFATITAYVAANQLTAQIGKPFPRFPGSDTLYDFPASGEWSLDTPVTTLSGLGHLEGQTVVGLSDGIPVSPRVVTGGEVTLNNPATRIVIGLQYICDLQTLRLPLAVGRRKTVTAATAMVDESCALLVGPTFDKLTQMKELLPAYPPRLVSEIALTNIQNLWDKKGQVCFRQEQPLPANILGIVLETDIGDSAR